MCEWDCVCKGPWAFKEGKKAPYKYTPFTIYHNPAGAFWRYLYSCFNLITKLEMAILENGKRAEGI